MSGIFRIDNINNNQLHKIQVIKTYADDLYNQLNDLEDSREKSLAITKLEECVMWACKHIAINENI